ncbi:hypothetical protein SGPA1_11947 [Streptomyces misionensis JCM 4497]
MIPPGPRTSYGPRPARRGVGAPRMGTWPLTPGCVPLFPAGRVPPPP